MKEIKLKKVTNGFMLSIECYGKNMLQEPFNEYREVFVFPTLKEAMEWMDKFFAGVKQK